MQEPEFNIGDTVTLDRYNHIEDVETVKIVDYGTIGWGENERLTYIMDVKGTKISSTGISIMESKDYEPCPDEDRHCRINASVQEREEYWENKRKK